MKFLCAENDEIVFDYFVNVNLNAERKDEGSLMKMIKRQCPIQDLNTKENETR